ncbi:MAG: YfdQ family protein [Azoarcus sp.]|jgi:uncharacterized protein YfdQ (DUF2303 family)|nr:YfdQ family protein [Azoarcus sp.]
MSNTDQIENIAHTLERALPRPVEIGSNAGASLVRVALPPGWNLKTHDDSFYLPAPIRKRATVSVDTADSFIDYVKRHGSLTSSTIWAQADYDKGDLSFLAIINDHGDEPNAAAWRDHTAKYVPLKSAEWRTWHVNNEKLFSQVDFAAFIESNLGDISTQTVDGKSTPSGTDMLKMALAFEAKQDMRFKSAFRLQSGGVDMAFTNDDDAATVEKMQAFDRFAIGIPVFDGTQDGYVLHARLRYRVKEGRLFLWYELIRPDKVLKAASETLIATIREKTGTPFFFGNPFAD